MKSASMIQQSTRFPIFMLVSLVLFVAILLYVMRRRVVRPSYPAIAVVSAIVVVGGMFFAKFGQNTDWPWWIYYTLPAGVTLLLPPLAFRLSRSEILQYLTMAFVSAPVVHVAFSFFLGWHDYMPFLKVPSLHDLLK